MGEKSKDRVIRSRFQRIQALRVQALLEGAQSNGVSGVVQTVYRMIDPRQPPGFAECLEKADADFANASTPEGVWGAALGMAECLLEAKLEVVLEPVDPPEPDPDPGPGPPKPASAGNLVLAALLARLHGQIQTTRPTVAVVETAQT